jgi:hypothetical protein
MSVAAGATEENQSFKVLISFYPSFVERMDEYAIRSGGTRCEFIRTSINHYMMWLDNHAKNPILGA